MSCYTNKALTRRIDFRLNGELTGAPGIPFFVGPAQYCVWPGKPGHVYFAPLTDPDASTHCNIQDLLKALAAAATYYGISRAELVKKTAPVLRPAYIAVDDRERPTYSVSALQGDTPRTLAFYFGDGRSTAAPIPAGSDSVTLNFTAPTPFAVGRYVQRATSIDFSPAAGKGATAPAPGEEAPFFEGLTDVCVPKCGASSTPYVPTRIDGPDHQTRGRFGERLASAQIDGVGGDLDGDGVNDFFAGANVESVGSVVEQGRVWAMSGRTLTPIYTIDSPDPQPYGHFGFYLSTLGDIDRDGVSDIAVGSDDKAVANVNHGKAWVFSGATGRLLYAVGNPNPQPSSNQAVVVTPLDADEHGTFGSRVGRAGDINGDGIPDLIVGAPTNDVCTPTCRIGDGQAFIFNGVNGALLRTLNLPAADRVASCAGTWSSPCALFGQAVQSPGDLTRDGVPDQQVDAGGLTVNGTVGQGRVYLFNGATGAVLSRIDDPVPQGGATFGFQDAAPNSPGDINSDGVPDIYANGWGQDGSAGAGQGRAWIFDGAASVAAGSGVVLVTVDDPSPELGGQFGWSMATTDYDNDGRADFYVGQSPHHVGGATGSGGSYVFDGPASAVAHVPVFGKPLELPEADRQISRPSNLGPNLGWGLAAPGDLDGDGHPDYLAGAPFKDVGGGMDEGQVFAFLSRERPPPADFDGTTTTDIAVYRPSAGQWFTKDGWPEATGYGTSGDLPVPADYNGDGRTDVTVFRPASGTWFSHFDCPYYYRCPYDTTVTWGISGDIPVPGDYNGDGKADIAVWRPSTGTWFVQGGATVAWGTSGDIPVPGDYDGDGTTDLAVFRPSEGVWYLRNSTGDAVRFGTNGDIPVPGDYDGDGITDLAVYRPGLGAWFVNDGATLWGTSGDIPVPGDYDGNGTTDIAVYRNGVWFVKDVPPGTVSYGTAGDKPLALPSAIRQFFFP